MEDAYRAALLEKARREKARRVAALTDTGFVEQTMSGVNEGIGGMLGFPVDVVSGAINATGQLFGREEPLIQNPVGGSQWLNEGPLSPTISDTQPQNVGQRYGRRIGREVGASVIPTGAMMRGAQAPMALAGMGLASATGAGVAGQTSREIAPDNDVADLIASLAGGMVPIAAANALRRGPQAPSMDDLRRQQGEAYEAVDQSKARLDPAQRQQLVDRINTRARVEGMDELLHPKAHRTTDLMNKIEASPTIADVERKRRFIGDNVAGSLDPSEARVGMAMRDEVDGYMRGLANQGDIGADAASTLTDLERARELTQRIKKSETVMEALTKAERRAASSGTGGNAVNTMRQNIRSILDNPKKIRGFSAAERAAMEEIVRGTPSQNALRLAGRLSPTAGALPAMGGLASGATFGPLGAVPSVVGLLAKGGAEHLTSKSINSLTDMIRAGGPLVKEAITGDEIRAVIAALMSRAPSEAQQ